VDDEGKTVTDRLPYPLPEGTRLAPHEIGGGYLYRQDELLLNNRIRRDGKDRSALQQVLEALADDGVRRQVATDIVIARRQTPDLPWPGSDYQEPPYPPDDAAGYGAPAEPDRPDVGDDVDAVLGRLDLRPTVTDLPNGLVKLTLPKTDLTDDLVPIVVARLDALEFTHGRTPPQVTPNHVLWGAGHGRPYAVAPPYPAEAPCPLPEADEAPVRRVRIALLDGPVNPDHPLFLRSDGTRRVELFDESAREVPPADDTVLPAYAGHGDFMAGVALTQAPEATVLAIRVLREDGTVDDDELALALGQVPDDVDIVLMCLGGYAHDNRAMPATGAALEKLRSRAPQVLFVAGAGNDSVDTELFPAAFADVLGIGAVNAEGEPTCFTNFGPWVDACADGSKTVSAFVSARRVTPADKTENCLGVHNPGTVDFCGWASWRGTSVSAARFAGKVAARMADEFAAGTAEGSLAWPPSREVAARMVFLATTGFVHGLGPRV
jgi:hypothetical protein